MRTVFLDTSYLLALSLRRDEYHARALELERTYQGQLLTTEFVGIEYHDAMCQATFRSVAHAMWNRLVADPNVTVVRVSSALLEVGRELYLSMSDKDWSLTDCISFVVMRENGVFEAFSSDHHFEQAGVKALLRT